MHGPGKVRIPDFLKHHAPHHKSKKTLHYFYKNLFVTLYYNLVGKISFIIVLKRLCFTLKKSMDKIEEYICVEYTRTCPSPVTLSYVETFHVSD